LKQNLVRKKGFIFFVRYQLLRIKNLPIKGSGRIANFFREVIRVPSPSGKCIVRTSMGFSLLINPLQDGLERDLYYERIPTKSLREDIRLLGTFLGRVIRDQEGKEIFELIEKIRLLSKINTRLYR